MKEYVARLAAMERRLVCRGVGVAVAVTLALSAARPASVAAQSCSWGGTSTTPAPEVVFLRTERELLRTPGRLAVSSTGDLFTIDPDAGRIVVRDAYGTPLSILRPVKGPLAIAVDVEGSAYIADLDSRSVRLFDPNWKEIGALGRESDEFVLPTDVAHGFLAAREVVVVVDAGADQVKVFDATGVLLFAFGSHGSGAGQFDFPVAVFVSVGGEIYVGDQNNDRVQVFAPDGTFLRCFGSRSTSFSRRFGRIQSITGDELGRIYVADAFQGNVRVFDSNGVLIATIGGLGQGLGELRTPSGLAIDLYNRLFVASRNNARLEVFGIDDFLDPPAPPGAALFFDGFETGDLSAWAGVVP